MFGILLLIAAAFSGGEVVVNAATSAPPPGLTAGANQTDALPMHEATDTPASPVAIPAIDHASPGPRVRLASDIVPALAGDADLDAAALLVSDADNRAPSAASPRPGLGPHLVRNDERYASQGRQVVIEVLRPDDDSQRPAILILHGASGMGDGTFYRGAAEIFAERGYVTYIPHYLATIPSGSKLPAPKSNAKKVKTHPSEPSAQPEQPASIRAGFPAQEQVLHDALDHMAKSPYVDSTRIGVFGMSLGGFHALTLSSRDERIIAVVDMSGALRGNVMPETNRLPPTLELHGGRDAIVPVSRARSLAEELKKRGIPHELMVYPDQGHFFRGKAQQDALQRSAAFFRSYLTPFDTNHAAR